jgi:hypothetical protein
LFDSGRIGGARWGRGLLPLTPGLIKKAGCNKLLVE